MASYRFNSQIVSRGAGRNVVAAAAYRAGEQFVDERTGVIYDLSNKKDVVHKEIFLPSHAPEWMANREQLWNAVELSEKRKDAQLAREVQLTLPRELTLTQNMELVREFVKAEFVARGMVADVCIHNPKASDGLGQPHAHVLLSLRDVDEQGFGFKNRSWNDKALLVQWREEWANCENRHLSLHGFEQKVDHRSYKEQGIALEPQYKIGPIAAKERMARLADHQRIARENGQLIFERPEIALDAITRGQSTFTHQDLGRFINRHTEDSGQFNAVFERVKSSPELVFLGLDEQGRQRFSTRAMLAIESSMMSHAHTLNHRMGHEVNERALLNAKSSRTLSQEQETALDYLASPGDMKSLLGYAGTGKSYLLGAAKEAWEQSGYRVCGAALSGIAALNLSDSSGIESRTIASLLYRLDKGALALNARDILVVDEAGMLGSRTMERLTREVEKACAKLVLVGDWQQLQAIEAGAAFRAIAENYQYVELNHIRRQTTPWQVQASLHLAQGAVDKALHAYDIHDQVHRFKSTHEAKSALIAQWNEVRLAAPTDSQIILAYTRKEVKELNEMARGLKRKHGELGDDVVFPMERGERAFATNDRVYFLKREDSLSVINGTLGTIQAIDAQSGVITVALDRDDLKTKPKIIQVNTNLYKHLEHGYAATVYKAQGVTVDRAYVLPTSHYDAHSTYVAMTRHRKSCELFVSREVFAHDQALAHLLNRNRAKDVTLDYTQMEGEFCRQRAIAPSVQQNSMAQEPNPTSKNHALTAKEAALQYRQQQELKKENLNSLCAQLRAKNSAYDAKGEAYLASLVSQRTNTWVKEYEHYKKLVAEGLPNDTQQTLMSQLLRQISSSTAMLRALEQEHPKIALELREQLQMNQQNKGEHPKMINQEMEL